MVCAATHGWREELWGARDRVAESAGACRADPGGVCVGDAVAAGRDDGPDLLKRNK